jgi:hypothetical protein
MEGTQSKSTQSKGQMYQKSQKAESDQILEWRLYIANRLKRFSDAIFVIDASKAVITATSMSAKTGTVLIFLRSFDAVFVMDILRLVFTATHTKNNIDLIFLDSRQ